ncbi:helix-turn-helix transcriptional regulator [Limnohabitans sp. Bal53]|uniref:helix-turn-helix domain-containing protein n=1 Tax=Limnohabitans sp. Bal53 TaxID=1977910 RepID=UPI000D389A35|nr:helix-turn-helix transcriptional regulator [Limnohabitans sp. Bal53]PUE40178.1 hypothetical protein B9Z50_12000 [Limnohabitans sp. Bal53]
MLSSLHHKRYAKLRVVQRDVRQKAGHTQVQLAKQLSMEQSNLSKIERRERYLDNLLFIDFCHACGADPADVINMVLDSVEPTL